VIAELAKVPGPQAVLRVICPPDPPREASQILEGPEFRDLFSETRKDFMVSCLSRRCDLFMEAISC